MKVTNDSWHSRTLRMTVKFESAHCNCREIHIRIGFGPRSVESVVEWCKRQNMFKTKCAHSTTTLTICAPTHIVVDVS